MAELRFTKWGGHGHWRFPTELLGTDQHGTWLGGHAGTQAQRGDEPPITMVADFVTLVPADGCWIARFNGAGAGSAIYIDVTTRPVLDGDTVHVVDLDLDVVLLHDGTVELLDEDEFAEHQIRYGYPPEVIAQARATAEELVARVAAGDEPFGTAGPAQLTRLAAHAHVDRFNAAVRTGDWQPLVATLHPDAVLDFPGLPIGPYAGRNAIAAAYAADPPGDTMRVLDVHGDMVSFAWSRGGTGTMEFGRRDGRISRLLIRFD